MDNVKQVVKSLVMVNGLPDFDRQYIVANGASDLLVELYGDRGRHTRSAVGMGSLPRGSCVEIEMIVEVSG
jgi:enamine deaminase RidA (YjgF/YER057c/UK114 family)